MKKIEEDTDEKIYHFFVDWKNQYCQNDYNTQDNPQIQCNPYQITNGIFYRARTKYLITCKEIQKTPNSQRNLEKKKKMELEESGSLSSDYTTKVQSSKLYGTGTKIE